MEKQKSKDVYSEYVQPFIIGSISGSLPCLVSQPVDNTKVVIQLRREAAGRGSAVTSPVSVVKDIFAESGVKGLYRGLDSAVLRQIIYCGIRMGLYKLMENHTKEKYERNLIFAEKTIFALFTGAVGSAVANPTDVSLVRFQADNNLPQKERRNYGNVINALATILKEEGIKGFWVGAAPSIARATVVNCAHLVAYGQTKQIIVSMSSNQSQEETMTNRLISSIVSGIAVSYLSLPFDNAKTKMMKMKADSSGIYPYKSLADCFRKSINREGLLSLWVGLPTYFCRVAPHAMLSLLLQDYLHDILTHRKTFF